MKFCFVDEDISQIRPFWTELILRGHDIEVIEDADSAYLKLQNSTDFDLIFIDVMLAVYSDKSRSVFNRTETSDFKLTGIALLDKLTEQNKKDFPSKAVFLSMASSKFIVTEINSACKKHNVECFYKNDFATPFDFGERIERFIRDRS